MVRSYFSSRRSRNVVIGKTVSRTFFFQPSLANDARKKLDSERSEVDCAPVQAVDSVRKIAPTERALTKKDGRAVLFDPMGRISAGPDVIHVVHSTSSPERFCPRV